MTHNRESKNPIPQGNYLPASRSGDIVFTAGMTPRREGVLIRSGKVLTTEPIHSYKKVVEQATENAMTAALNMMNDKERLGQVLMLHVYVNAQASFEDHSALADYASAYLYENLGESAVGSRAAVGVGSLPGNAPVEIQIIASVVADKANNVN